MRQELNPRRGRILKHVVEEYVVTALPVSSDTLVKKYVPSVSSATVRNELAALEGLGYLSHPHTSAGRVPSDAGYRYYVQWLMSGVRLSETEERTISHQFHQVELSVDQWVRLAASVLVSRLQNSVMVVPPISSTARLRHLDLVPIGTAGPLLVVMLQSGAVKQKVLRFPDEVSMESLVSTVRGWNEELFGRSAREIRGIPVPPDQQVLKDAVVQLLEDSDRESAAGTPEMHLEGLGYMAAQPEFGTSDRLQPVMDALEHDGVLSSLMEPLLRSGGVYVAIGQEQPLERLRDCTVVLAAYGRPAEMMGVVAVIGPTRLAYWRTVPMVGYVAGMLGHLLEDTFLS